MVWRKPGTKKGINPFAEIVFALLTSCQLGVTNSLPKKEENNQFMNE
jgi:hypothetical protein